MAELGSSDQWIGVFKQRQVWELTPGDIERWVQANKGFFGLLAELVPAGGRVLELGCGPGRHALGAASLGLRVQGIDIDPEVVRQATVNAASAAPEADVTFVAGDIEQLDAYPPGVFDAVTHGGLMEHFPSADEIRASLRAQLRVAPRVIFDVPVGSEKNLRLFERDTIFRQVWSPGVWLDQVLAGLCVARWCVEEHFGARPYRQLRSGCGASLEGDHQVVGHGGLGPAMLSLTFRAVSSSTMSLASGNDRASRSSLVTTSMSAGSACGQGFPEAVPRPGRTGQPVVDVQAVG